MVKKIDNPIRATSKLAQEKEVGTEGKESREGERERGRERLAKSPLIDSTFFKQCLIIYFPCFLF